MSRAFIAGRWITDPADATASYQPMFKRESWFRKNEAMLRRWVTNARPATANQGRNYCLHTFYLARFLHQHGLSLDPEVALTPEHVNWYIAVGMATYVPENRSTARSVLRAVARANTKCAYWPENDKISRRLKKPPYAGWELDGLVEVSGKQRTPYWNRVAQAIIAFGAGAGLRTFEMRLMRAEHVRTQSGFVLLDVPGRAARTVPVRRRFEDSVLRLADQYPEEFLVGHFSADSKEPLHRLGENLRIPKRLPALDPIRLRATWLVNALAGPADYATVTKAAGVKRLEIDGFLPYLPATDTALSTFASLTGDFA